MLAAAARAGVWTTPTIDPERNVMYVTTGDNYSEPTTGTSDAVLALALDSGKILWSKQLTAGDAPLDDPDDLLAPRADDHHAEGVADGRVAGDLRDQRLHHRPEGGLGQAPDRVEDDLAQLGPGVASRIDRQVRGRQLEEEVEGERLLRRPASVDGRLADPSGRDASGGVRNPSRTRLAGGIEDRAVTARCAGGHGRLRATTGGRCRTLVGEVVALMRNL